MKKALSLVGFDHQQANKLFEGNVDDFLSLLPILIDELKIYKTQLIQENSIDEIKMLAHKLKGAAATMCLSNLVTLAATLEYEPLSSTLKEQLNRELSTTLAWLEQIEHQPPKDFSHL